MITVNAVFENGVFRPTDEVQLPDNSAVELRFRVKPPIKHDGDERGEDANGEREAPPIEEKLTTLASQVPPDEWNRLPDDLSDNLDHFIYGTPKS